MKIGIQLPKLCALHSCQTYTHGNRYASRHRTANRIVMFGKVFRSLFCLLPLFSCKCVQSKACHNMKEDWARCVRSTWFNKNKTDEQKNKQREPTQQSIKTNSTHSKVEIVVLFVWCECVFAHLYWSGMSRCIAMVIYLCCDSVFSVGSHFPHFQLIA